MTDKGTLAEYLYNAVKNDFGEGSVVSIDPNSPGTVEPLCSTGYVPLDDATGIGGLPRGRIVEVYGPESSGKTTLALHACAEVQKKSGAVVFIDTENALDVVYAQAIGVNTDDIVLAYPDCAEHAFDLIISMIENLKSYKKGKQDLPLLIVVDSVAALVPKAELDGEMGDLAMGAHARIMSKGLRVLTNHLKRDLNVTIIFINQIRQKIGVMFGNPETTTGGNALKFYSSMRFDVRRGKAVKYGDEHVANETRITIVKNKCAPPFKKCQCQIRFGIGIDKLWDVFNTLKEGNVIKGKTWMEVEGQEIPKFQGYNGFCEAYSVYSDVFDSLYSKLRNSAKEKKKNGRRKKKKDSSE